MITSVEICLREIYETITLTPPDRFQAKMNKGERKQMISNHILQSTIESIKKVSNHDLYLLDTDGNIQLATSKKSVNINAAELEGFANSQSDVITLDNYIYFKIYELNKLTYILMISGDSADSFLVGKMAALQVQGLFVAYKERFDKDNFIKNLLMDNLLLVDIYQRAKRLHIENLARRVVFILECSPDRDQGTIENMRLKFGDKDNDFVTAVDETSVIVVKELEEKDNYETIRLFAQSIMNAVGQDSTGSTRVAYGTIADELKDVSRSYKEANMALNIGKIFFQEKDIIAYNTLGIGRLIYQLPIPLCKMFIKEIFANKSPDEFDEETLETINTFLENNLNVSETSRKLFIHRNTLVYRLDKLQKLTGLNLRVFDDAMTFQIALMVVRYMKYMDTLDY